MLLEGAKVLETMTRKEKWDLTYLYDYKLIKGYINMRVEVNNYQFKLMV